MDSSPPHVPSSIFHFTPSSSPSSSGSNFPVLVIAVIGILATAFLLVSYYVFVMKCCLNWRRSDDAPPPAYSPADTSRGLDESLIRLIPVIRFRKEGGKGGKTEYFECAVCLSEFREGEKLRVIPNCCHAFHIDCIDVWLQSHANCPVCRSCISSNTLCAIRTRPPGPGRFTGNDADYVVIEIRHNNLDDPILVRGSNSPHKSPISIATSSWKTEHLRKDLQTSFDDDCINIRPKNDDFDRVYPIRRSISMDLSSHRQLCSEIREALEQDRGNRKPFFSFR